MATITTSLDGRRVKVSVNAEVSAPIYVSRSAVIAAVPGSGGTMLIEASFSQVADVAAGTANWFPWDAGSVSVATVQALNGATAIRFTAAAAAGIGEVSQ